MAILRTDDVKENERSPGVANLQGGSARRAMDSDEAEGIQPQALASTAFGLADFMAAIRRLESGSYAGNYGALGRQVKGDRARGAYQIMSKNWKSWAAMAGIPGADWRSSAAQDKVAAHMMNRYYERYRDWDLVAVAWYSGGSNADTLVKRGWGGKAGNIRNKHIRGYVNKIRGFYPEAQKFTGSSSNSNSQVAYGLQTGAPGGGVMFPLPGSESRWRDTWGASRGGGSRTHKGADISASHGSPLVAVTDGYAYSGFNSTAGNFVYVTDNAGKYRYFYAHLAKAMVPRGSGSRVRVTAGAQIGTVGATGNAAGPHLHFGVYNLQENRYINPTSWLNAAKTGGSVYAAPPMQGQFGDMPADPNAPGGGTYQGDITYEGMLRAFFDEYANSAAGGKRLDVRTIGLEPEEGQGPAETLIGGDRGLPGEREGVSVIPISREVDAQDSTDGQGI